VVYLVNCRMWLVFNVRGVDWRLKEIMISSLDKLKCVPLFGDVIGATGGAEETSRARIRCARTKFRELAAVLTSRELLQN